MTDREAITLYTVLENFKEVTRLREENRALKAMAENDSWSKELQDALQAIPARFQANDYWVNGIRRMAEENETLAARLRGHDAKIMLPKKGNDSL